MPTSAHSRHSVRVASSTPSLAAITNSAQSADRSPARISPTKSAYPGVSTRLTLMPSCTSGATAREIERPWACSDSSKSHTVVPSRTEPARGTAPAEASSVSTSVVLPEPPGPTTTTLRIRSGLLASRSWPAGLRELPLSAIAIPPAQRQLLFAASHKGYPGTVRVTTLSGDVSGRGSRHPARASASPPCAGRLGRPRRAARNRQERPPRRPRVQRRRARPPRQRRHRPSSRCRTPRSRT